MTRRRATTRLAILLVTLGASCDAPTHPPRLATHCTAQAIDTPQGPWITGDSVCTWTNLDTGEGGPGRAP